jgi:uncharacterized protein YkwD
LCAVLLTGVVIGRLSTGPKSDEVYLRNVKPSPTATATPKQRLLAQHDRPALQRVARTTSPPMATDVGPSTRPSRSAGVFIDGFGNGGDRDGSQVTTFNGGGAEPGDPAALEAAVVQLVNAERQKRGCGALRVDPRLVASARAHSTEMAATGTFGHGGPSGSDPWKRMAAAGYPYDKAGAENIARGYATAEEAVRKWMGNAGFRGNILNCGLVATGVGVSLAPGGPWWTQDFGYA